MLQYASFTGFLRTILIILLVYYALKILARLFAPHIFKFLAKKAEQRFGAQFGQFQQRQEPTRKEGEVSVDKMPNKQAASNKTVGEYVDYEEID